MSLQTCIHFFILLNTEEDMKSVGNQTVASRKNVNIYYGSQWLWATNIIPKYIILCLTEKTNSYGFGITWVFVNVDTIYILGELSLFRQQNIKPNIYKLV